MKPAKILSKNKMPKDHYIDDEGDYWENIKVYTKFKDAGISDVAKLNIIYFCKSELGKVINLEEYSDKSISGAMWGIAELYTKEDNPEYFL